MEYYLCTLPNGIRCIHKPARSTAVHCALTIDSGSRDDRPDRQGTAHLAEHSLFKGTKRRRAYQINSRLENLGGELNAFTTKEDTVVHATTLRGDYSKAVELISDMVFDPTFPEKEVAKEREIIIDEINSCKDSPSELIFDHFEELLFAGSSLAYNILGNKQSVRRLISDDVREFCRRTYNTDRMVFSSTGNISQGHFERVMERYLSPRPMLAREFARERPADNARFDRRIRKGTYQAHCMLGTKATGLHDEKRIPMNLLTNILGGPSANSILNCLLRERHSLTYSIEANYSPMSDTGLFSIYFGADAGNIDSSLELIYGELRSLREKPLSPRRLSLAKRQFTGQLALSLEHNDVQALGLGKSLLTYDSIEPVQQIYRRIASITAAELTECANELFGSELSTLIYI